MKQLLTTITIILTLSSFTPASNTPFCKGWEHGHCSGWKSVKGEYAICPIAPICPIPPLECAYADYRCGFTLGVLAGAKAAKGERP
jgi:hypothetical protein